MSYTQIDHPRLRELLETGAQLVEVLPEGEFTEVRIPGAVNIPLKALDADTTASSTRHERWWSTAGTASET